MSTHPSSSLDAARWRRVEDICDAALRLGESERQEYLALTCAGDSALRREVEGLLAHAAKAEKFLTSPLGEILPVAEPPRDLIGTRVADYRIVAKLGEGGMGEVYRARDERLGRDVAIKVLPAAVASDAERLKRFEREARLLARINHASIGAIYGLVEADGLRALVLELIDGETLSAALDRGTLKLKRALTLAAQIADALDHAHRLRITHRDLKPSNIMLAASGIKLLDFGIGHWTPPDGDGGPTRSSTLTAAGAIVGTLHYMSPEQLEGRETDARSDIFSFGAVLYEMVTGAKAFDGKSQAGIIAAVLEAPAPKLTNVGGTVGARLDRIVTKCLAKHPDDRWQSARDLGDELRWLLAEVAEGKTAAPPERSSSPRRTTTIAASAAAIATVALIGWAMSRRAPSAEIAASPISFIVEPQDGLLDDGQFDISPDGRQIVYTASTATASVLYLRRLDRFDSVVLPTTGAVFNPVFSPDGQWVAYHGNGVLRKISASGDAPPVVLTNELSQRSELDQTFQLRWENSEAVLLVSRNQPIRRVAANGGRLENVTTVRETEIDHHGPEPLPAGRALLFTVHGKRNRFSIAAQDLVTGERKIIIESAFSPVYSPTGHLLFARGQAILAVPFDERSLEVRGEAVTLVEGVESMVPSGLSFFRISKNGTLVFQAEFPPSARQLTWVDRTGRETLVSVPAQPINSVRLSPDGKQFAFYVNNKSRGEIWTWATESGALTRLTQDGDNWGPIWTPDGSAVIYGRDGGDAAHVVRHPLNGAPIETLGTSVDNLWPADLTRDGEHLIVTALPPTDEFFLAQLNRGSAVPQTLLKKSGFPRWARLSPDGRWLAYQEQVGNRQEVFIQAFPEPGQRRQVSVDGGSQPVWRRDGKELFFRGGTRMLSVAISTAPALQWGAPTLLFDRRYFGSPSPYDVAADGRFLMIKPAPVDDSPGQLKVAVNWLDELVRRVPVRR